MGEKLGLYDLETREDRGTVIIPNLQDMQNKKKYSEMKKSIKEFNAQSLNDYGNFYFLFTNVLSNKIEKQHIIRFLYLCTYSNYTNNLIYKDVKGDGHFMVAKELQEVLKLSERETRNTKNVLEQNSLIFIDKDNRISINELYSVKGSLDSDQKKSKFTRIFENAIKELYEKASAREHKQLGLLIELLPHINLKFNIVCENPECEDRQDIIPINLTKLATMMGYAEDKNSATKFKRGLFNIKVAGECVIMINSTDNGGFVTVNPRVYYKGTRDEDVKYLKTMFSVAKKL